MYTDNGQLSYLQYIHENKYHLDKITCKKAATVGYLDYVKCAIENGCNWDHQTCYREWSLKVFGIV